MGACSSSDSPMARREAERNRKIDEALAKAARAERSHIKLLLLGAGESGKSTIFKQFQILYGEGFSDDYRLQLKPSIHTMVLIGIHSLLDYAESLGLEGQYSQRELDAVRGIRKVPDDVGVLGPGEGALIRTLWESKPVQGAWDRKAQFQIAESNEHFFADIERVAAPSYVPTVDDILLLRIRTTGIIEQDMVIDGVPFRLVDVGGQRNERKKWIHCFDQVSAVLFVAAISEYDQVLFEDYTQNRMVEALMLFEEILGTRYFMHKPMILFLNKSDIFREKIAHSDITSVPAFADYDGAPDSFDDGVKYFAQKFEGKDFSPNRKIYTHVTCATSTDK